MSVPIPEPSNVTTETPHVQLMTPEMMKAQEKKKGNGMLYLSLVTISGLIIAIIITGIYAYRNRNRSNPECPSCDSCCPGCRPANSCCPSPQESCAVLGCLIEQSGLPESDNVVSPFLLFSSVYIVDDTNPADPGIGGVVSSESTIVNTSFGPRTGLKLLNPALTILSAAKRLVWFKQTSELTREDDNNYKLYINTSESLDDGRTGIQSIVFTNAAPPANYIEFKFKLLQGFAVCYQHNDFSIIRYLIAANDTVFAALPGFSTNPLLSAPLAPNDQAYPSLLFRGYRL